MNKVADRASIIQDDTRGQNEQIDTYMSENKNHNMTGQDPARNTSLAFYFCFITPKKNNFLCVSQWMSINCFINFIT